MSSKAAASPGSVEIPHLTGFYPPLFHSVIAIFYALLGKSIHSAMLANLPAIAILLFATYGLGKRLMTPFAAATAAVLANFFPLMLWLSRETLIDYWLAAFVTLAMLCLYRTEGFSKRSESAPVRRRVRAWDADQMDLPLVRGSARHLDGPKKPEKRRHRRSDRIRRIGRLVCVAMAGD